MNKKNFFPHKTCHVKTVRQNTVNHFIFTRCLIRSFVIVFLITKIKISDAWSFM